MAFADVKLIPGVNVEQTPTLLQSGYVSIQLGRFKNGLVQKYGGWERFYSLVLGGVPKAIHAWSDLNADNHLMVGTTTQLGAITDGSFDDLTPQRLVSSFTPPDFSTTSGSATVEVTDANITDVTIYDSVLFDTPISVGGIILSGLYPISQPTGTGTYEIEAATLATATVASGGAVPEFTTTAASSIVNVMFEDHGLAVGDTIVFPIATTSDGVTIDGSYLATSIVDADNFEIAVSTQATAGATFDMNGSDVELVYYITLGPPPAGAGYGLGGYGEGGYGTGVLNPAQQGDPITATDWTLDNWGQIGLACPKDDAIYYWDPTGGFYTAAMISSGPIFNKGIFVSTSQQILIAYGSTVQQAIGIQQDPMWVEWCDTGNFFDWVPTTTNQAGGFRIPIGSEIMGGMAVANQNLIWTDLDLWAMNYIGYPYVYGFNKIGAGAGLVSQHAAQQLRGAVYWMGRSNFYVYNSGGPSVIPCPIWDAVFQNLNTDYLQNIRAMPNTPFNEAGWFFPSLSSVDGECDSYAKVNITEPGAPWDYGTLARSAWIDQNVFGSPIATTPGGIIYQHEMGNDADGQPMSWSFMTGYFYLQEGEDFCFVDQVIPDFKWGTFTGAQTAQLQITFFVVNYPGETPTQYGPFLMTKETPYVMPRFRARQMSMLVQGSDSGSFARLGKIRFRYSASGRR
jgi:hypothetical protein